MSYTGLLNKERLIYLAIQLVDFGYCLSTRWAVPSGQKTFSPTVTLAKRRLHSDSCLSHPSQSRDNILSPCYDTCHKLLIRLSDNFPLIHIKFNGSFLVRHTKDQGKARLNDNV
jgi:hypothetical protein